MSRAAVHHLNEAPVSPCHQTECVCVWGGGGGGGVRLNENINMVISTSFLGSGVSSSSGLAGGGPGWVGTAEDGATGCSCFSNSLLSVSVMVA